MSNKNLEALPRNTAKPLYQQIKDAILDKIRRGEWLAGAKVPSENTLVDELSVSRMTINRALRELTQQGYLERVHGIGTFVTAPPRHASLIEIRDIAEVIQASGNTHRSDIRLLQEENADTATAERMEIEVGTPVFHIVMLHYQNDVPIQFEDRYVNPELVPDFQSVDFTQHTPTEYLISLFRPDEMEHIVQAVLPDEEVCEMLAIESGEPCLKLLRRTWVKGAVVTTVAFTYPGNRYDLGARYSTEDYHRHTKKQPG